MVFEFGDVMASGLVVYGAFRLEGIARDVKGVKPAINWILRKHAANHNEELPPELKYYLKKTE